MVEKTLKVNPFRNSNPMSWEDAAKVSAVLAVAVFFTVFLIPYDYNTITTNYKEFIFEATRFLGCAFFTNFIALAGLTQYTKRKQEDSG